MDTTEFKHRFGYIWTEQRWFFRYAVQLYELGIELFIAQDAVQVSRAVHRDGTVLLAQQVMDFDRCVPAADLRAFVTHPGVAVTLEREGVGKRAIHTGGRHRNAGGATGGAGGLVQ